MLEIGLLDKKERDDMDTIRGSTDDLAAQSWIFWKCQKQIRESLPLTESRRHKGTGKRLWWLLARDSDKLK